ncbi:holin [Phage MedPE-SWcel-C56]|uniref:Holin n=1 Tax=Phage MedPE-SWcel-C56 TaxID=1871314 RepID=A0A1B1IY48_9CAUD|nr:holin [Phage MedPE-SWcel-C56]ANS06244.1 hypothetical protein [Phage MedPE-SWcel-C56]
MSAATLTALGPLAGGLFKLIDDLFTSEEERADARLKVMGLLSSERIAQMQVNAKEAEHKSMFVAGWRPAIGWIGALALGWQYILLPVFSSIVMAIAAMNGVTVDLTGLLQFNMTEMMPIILGMLGLGAARSFEKTRGVESNNMGGS